MSALLVTSMLAMSALVLDLGALRQHRAANRATTDHAAMAGAMVLASETGTTVRACQEAWAYFLDNSWRATSPVPPPCASAFAGDCENNVARPPAVGTAGAYTVTIANPVLDGDPLMRSDAIGARPQSPNPALDGAPCDRVAVRVVQRHDTYFAGAIGVHAADSSAHSVARSRVGVEEGGPVALLLLEPEGCDALTASGSASVIVRANGPKPGYITVDSSAKRCTSGYALDASGSPSRISAEASSESGAMGMIRQYALAPGQANARAYDVSDVAARPARLFPAPTPASRPLGRRPVDHRYNCTAAGQDAVLGTVDDCVSSATRPAYIDALEATLGGTGMPEGFQRYPRPSTSDRCATKPSDPPIVLPPGDWWVNCETLSIKSRLTFSSGSVVVDGAIEVTTDGSLTVNGDGLADEVLFVRDGDFGKTAQGTVNIKRTAVYLADGRLDFTGGSGAVTWVAPTGGSLEDLALWSESPAQHKLAGQANIAVDGVLFAPKANPFTVTGGGSSDQTVKAQFITRRLDITGSGTVAIQPDPERVVPIVIRGARLVR